VTTDPYTGEARLCDDDGIVSRDDPSAYRCTGSAHPVAGVHVRCTNPIHYRLTVNAASSGAHTSECLGIVVGGRTTAQNPPGAATVSLNVLAQQIHEISQSKAFWPNDRPRNQGEVLMLIVSEAAEALEAMRDGYPLSIPYYEGPDGVTMTYGEGLKPVGVPSEMADVIIRALDACAAWGIDIDRAVREKVAYNATRERLHGRAS
jgi:hypothetical protein